MRDLLSIGHASDLEAEYEWVYTVKTADGAISWRIDGGHSDAEAKRDELISLAIQAGLRGDYKITRRKRLTAIYLGREEEV